MAIESASEFKLFAGGQLVDDVPILNTFGNESYDGVYGSNYIDISDSLAGLPVSSDYTLELIQNQGPGGSSGIRAGFRGERQFERPGTRLNGSGVPWRNGDFDAGDECESLCQHLR